MSISPFLNIGVRAARRASKIILKAYDHLEHLTITAKGPSDFVTNADCEAEAEIIRVIHEAYPDHAILGEESGKNGKNEYTWIVDPIDGTNNFIHGHPHFAISIALKHNDHIEHGLIYDPLRQELFTASLGGGAYLNEHRIRIANNQYLATAIIAVDFSIKSGKTADFLRLLATLLPRVAATRRSGSGALDCAYVAAGRIDAICGFSFNPWDIAAGVLLIAEAGGLVADFTGKTADPLTSKTLFATNPRLFKLLIPLLQAALKN